MQQALHIRKCYLLLLQNMIYLVKKLVTYSWIANWLYVLGCINLSVCLQIVLQRKLILYNLLYAVLDSLKSISLDFKLQKQLLKEKNFISFSFLNLLPFMILANLLIKALQEEVKDMLCLMLCKS